MTLPRVQALGAAMAPAPAPVAPQTRGSLDELMRMPGAAIHPKA
jgi:hypothetical protein